jgi:hypothetical protein
MPSKKPILGKAMDRTEDGRLARPAFPDPRKTGTRLSQRLLPQVPHVAAPSSTRTRHTAGTKRGSR